MRRLVSVALFGLVLVLSGFAAAFDVRELTERMRVSVVLVKVLDGSGERISSGTGFFVSTEGRIVTNFHVIRRAQRLAATLSDGRDIGILGVLATDPAHDLAVLQVEGAGYPALALGETAVRPGEEIVVIGSPLGLSTTVSEGIVSAVREKGIEKSKRTRERENDDLGTESWGLQITAAISPGSSGSPIMLRSGEVVGVAVGTRVDGQAVNFGVPVRFLKELLAGIAPGAVPLPASVATEGPAKESRTRNLLLSAGFFGTLGAAWLIVGRLLPFLARRRRSASKSVR